MKFQEEQKQKDRLEIMENNTIGDFDRFMDRGDRYYENEEYHLAERMYSKALEVCADSTDALYYLARALVQQDKSEQALVVCHRLIDTDNKDAVYWGFLGGILFDLDRLPEAIRAYDRAILLDSSIVENYQNIAIALSRCGDNEESARLLERASELFPEDAEIFYSLGNAYRRLNALHRAVEAYRASITIDERYVNALNNLGLTLYELGRLSESKQYLRLGLSLSPDDCDLLFNLCRVLYDGGRIDDARLVATKLVEVHPDCDDAYVYLGKS